MAHHEPPPRSDTRPIRGVVATALGGRAVTLCICYCGELLRGCPSRCGSCRTFYSTAEILAALDRFAPLTDTEDAA